MSEENKPANPDPLPATLAEMRKALADSSEWSKAELKKIAERLAKIEAEKAALEAEEKPTPKEEEKPAEEKPKRGWFPKLFP